MEKFKASSPSVKVNGETVLSFVNAVPASKDNKLEVLKRYGIVDPQPGVWYSQQAWLDAFKQIDSSLGPVNMKLIGKAIPKNAKFPPMDSLKDAFDLLNKAYHLNHKGGEIGWYKLVSYDEKAKQLVLECNTPYPEAFDEGIALSLFTKFKPAGASHVPRVKIEKKKNMVYYMLNW